MERSLSILLPVQNCQATLARWLQKVLEIAADLTGQFEILVIDNGSTDQTVEVAHELSIQYPQLSAIRFTRRQNLAEVVRAGLDRTRGQIICLHEGAGPINVTLLRELWLLRDDEDLVLAQRGLGRDAVGTGLVERLFGGSAAAPAESSFHLLRRESLERLCAGAAAVSNRHEVRLRRDLPRGPEPRPATRRIGSPRSSRYVWEE